MTDVEKLCAALTASDRGALARAITLVESQRPEDVAASEALLQMLPVAADSLRIGITGVPGVGKSTFIDAFGSLLIEQGHRVAVLAVDPSSERSGGSILGDKTRMHRLSHNKNAYIRPSPGAGSLGGVAQATREACALCEAAGFDVVLIETIGVGQSEVAVSRMVDCFALLLLPGAGDELQGIKRGIVELADLLIVNKADGDSVTAAKQARNDYTAALQLLHGDTPPAVLTASSTEDQGLAEVWAAVQAFQKRQGANGKSQRRAAQRLFWFEDAVSRMLQERFFASETAQAILPGLRQQVAAGTIPPTVAARQLVERDA